MQLFPYLSSAKQKKIQFIMETISIVVNIIYMKFLLFKVTTLRYFVQHGLVNGSLFEN